MIIHVFIQNEAGSNRKHYHDEKTLEWKRVEELPRHYPSAYGFVVGTTADDGCNVDCFVITEKSLKTGALVECEIAGLMEQVFAQLGDTRVVVGRFLGPEAAESYVTARRDPM
ncbi:MAG: inorganic diphosphatase [Gemmatimonadales bacterium]